MVESVACDTSGNIYAVGWASAALLGQSISGRTDAFVVKYNSTGGLVWAKLLGTSSVVQGFDIVVDGSGNPVIAGTVNGSLAGQAAVGDFDFFVAKYNSSSGALLWLTQFGSSGADQVTDIAFDSGSNNIYVTGYTYGAYNNTANQGSSDIFVSKLSSSGTLLWARMLGTNASDFGYGLAVDSSSNVVYVAGHTQGALDNKTSNGDYDGFVAKYDSEGNKLWTVLLGTPARDRAVDVAFSSSTGHIYVCGFTSGSLFGSSNAGGQDAFLVKLDGAGAVVWTRLLGTGGNDQGLSVALDGSGNVYISGTASGSLGGQTSQGGSDAFVAKYTADGTRLWVSLIGTSEADGRGVIAIDSTGHVALAASTMGSFPGFTNAGSYDVFVTELN